ncbi:MAG: hypothetical protein KY454_12555 [Actinobacteria bacterium]|nr:hypothetical protein [Actinomycetota bacterium]MBW3651736.1 hypothetical protein [Actinomycetota bacterium]
MTTTAPPPSETGAPPRAGAGPLRRPGLTVAGLSVKPVARSMRWSPLLGATAAGLVLLWLLRPEGSDSAGTIGGLRLAAYLLAAGAGLALDERATPTLASSPTSLAARRGLRLAVALVPVALAWCLLLGGAWTLQGAGAPALPAGALTLEALGLVGFTLAAAAVAAARGGDGLGGAAAMPALTLLVIALLIAQTRWPKHLTMFPMGPGDPGWTVAHQRWALLAVVAVGALMATSRDPARRRMHLLGAGAG